MSTRGCGSFQGGEGERQGAQGVGVGGGHGSGDGGGAHLAAADGVLRQGVEDAGEQPAGSEAGHAGDLAQHVRLDREAEGQGGVGDVFGGTALAVDPEQITGMTFEEHLKVGRSGVAPGDGGKDPSLGGQDGQPAALFGEQAAGGLGGHVVGDQSRPRRHLELFGGQGGVGGQAQGLGAHLGSGGVGGGAGVAFGVALRGAPSELGVDDPRGGLLDEPFFGQQQGVGHGGEHRGFARAGWHRHHGVEVDRLHPARTDFHHRPPPGRGRERSQGNGASEVDRGLRERRHRGHLVGNPAGQGVDREGRQRPAGPERGGRVPVAVAHCVEAAQEGVHGVLDDVAGISAVLGQVGQLRQPGAQRAQVLATPRLDDLLGVPAGVTGRGARPAHVVDQDSAVAQRGQQVGPVRAAAQRVDDVHDTCRVAMLLGDGNDHLVHHGVQRPGVMLRAHRQLQGQQRALQQHTEQRGLMLQTGGGLRAERLGAHRSRVSSRTVVRTGRVGEPRE